MARSSAGAELRHPAPLVVRRVALAFLDDARRAARRYRDGDIADPELLHDFRVAVRRLRSWLRLWRGTLAGAVPRRDERRIRRIARATGAARDLDVHREWLARQRDAASPAERPDIEAVMVRFDAGRREATTDARDAARALVARYDRLDRRLATYRVRVREAGDTEVPFGAALAPVVRAAGNALRASLTAVTSPDDDEAIHEARIAAKRLRYLLEPVGASVAEVPRAVEELKSLQDHAGALHDGHVFETELAADAARASGSTPPLLVQQLRVRGDKAYARLEEDWLHDAADPFFARIHEIAARCAAAEASPPLD